MTIEKWLIAASQRIQSATPTLDAELLLCHHLGKNRAYLHGFSEQLLDASLYPTLDAALVKLECGYPLAYLLGEKDFWDMTLRVTEDTLIPRADTETLIETCQQHLPAHFSGKILDLGTGSGAIAIALSRVFPSASITATDVSIGALTVAQTNAQQWQVAPIEFIHADWFSPMDSPFNAKHNLNVVQRGGSDNSNSLPHVAFKQRQFDVIVSNPPYIETDDPHLRDLTYEPLTALTADDNGLADIKHIITQSAEKLLPDGWLMLEHGYDQGAIIRDLFASSGHWQSVQTIKDLGDNPRISIAQYKSSLSH